MDWHKIHLVSGVMWIISVPNFVHICQQVWKTRATLYLRP